MQPIPHLGVTMPSAIPREPPRGDDQMVEHAFAIDVVLDVVLEDEHFYVRLREHGHELARIGPFTTFDMALWVLEDYVDEGVGTSSARIAAISVPSIRT